MSERERLAGRMLPDLPGHVEYMIRQAKGGELVNLKLTRDEADSFLALLRSTESDERKDAVVGDARAFLVEVNQGGTWYRCAGRAYLRLEEAQRCVDRMIGDFSASSYRITPLFARPTEETRSSGAEEADAAWERYAEMLEDDVSGNVECSVALRAAIRAEIRTTKGGAV